MEDLKILAKPEPGESKDEFKARLRELMGADASAAGLVFPPEESARDPEGD